MPTLVLTPHDGPPVTWTVAAAAPGEQLNLHLSARGDQAVVECLRWWEEAEGALVREMTPPFTIDIDFEAHGDPPAELVTTRHVVRDGSSWVAVESVLRGAVRRLPPDAGDLGVELRSLLDRVRQRRWAQDRMFAVIPPVRPGGAV